MDCYNETEVSGIIYQLVGKETGCVYVGSTGMTLERRKKCHDKDYRMWKQDKSKSYLSCFILYETNTEVYIEPIEFFDCKTREELWLRETYWQRQIECVNIRPAMLTDEEKRERQKTNDKAYREANIDAIKQQRKEFYEANRDRINAERAVKYEENKEEIRAKQNERYANDEEMRKKAQERARKYLEENKEDISAKRKEEYQQNKEAILSKIKEKYANDEETRKKVQERVKKWTEDNKEVLIERRKKSPKVQCGCGGEFKEIDKKKHMKTQLHKKWDASSN
jgi:hypothetical protein